MKEKKLENDMICHQCCPVHEERSGVHDYSLILHDTYSYPIEIKYIKILVRAERKEDV
jgi:hypothetical protein